MKALLGMLFAGVLLTPSSDNQEIKLIGPAPLEMQSGQSVELDFGPVAQLGTTVLLDITARMDAPNLEGSSFFMKLTLNGREVNAAHGRTVSRLVNKPIDSPVMPYMPAPWYGAGGWRVVYAPDFLSARKASFYVGDPYRLVLDVTDLANPMAENRLTIQNSAAVAAPGRPALMLIISNLMVEVVDRPSPTMAPAEATLPINRGEPAAGPAPYRWRPTAGGGFVLTLGTRDLPVDSELSFPNAGVNRLVPADSPDSGGQPGWRPQMRTEGERMLVEAAGPDYALMRTVDFGTRKVTVRDTLSSRRNDPLGLRVRYEVSVPATPSPLVHVAGNPDIDASDYYSATNPSVFVGFSDSGIGLIAEDDVFRNQAWLSFSQDESAAGLRTEMLCLPPRGSYTLEWSIYPVASRDYYDFINLVREDWGSNYTVEGAWAFFDPDTILNTPPEGLGAAMKRLGIRFFCAVGEWLDPIRDKKHAGFGAEVLSDYWADYRGRLKRAIQKLHGVDPGLKVLVYYDSQRDSDPDAPERYKDSLITSPVGKPFSTNFSGRYGVIWSMVATSDDSFGKQMLQVADAYISEMGADGLYWDEMENVGYGYPLLTYSRWDGHSCIIDPKMQTVSRLAGLTTLLGESERLAVIKRVLARGGAILGNTPPATRAVFATRVQRMVEIQHNDYWHFEGDLGTPLGYAEIRKDFGNVVRALDQANLLVGTHWDYAFDFSRFSFPFTPVELHAGYLLGRERILASHSGNYGWPGERCLVAVHYYDKDGKTVTPGFVTKVTAKEARTGVDLKEGEAAILVRLPVVVELASGEAEFKEVGYEAGSLAMTAKAPLGVVVRAAGGEHGAQPGRTYRVSVDHGAPRLVTAEKDGSLRFEVRAADWQNVTVEAIRPGKK